MPRGYFAAFTIVALCFFQSSAFHLELMKDDTVQLAKCIVHIIEGLPRKILKTSFITNIGNSTLLTNVLRGTTVPVIVNSNEHNIYSEYDLRVYNDVVIITNYEPNIQSILTELLWNKDTKFITVCGPSCNVKGYLLQLWSEKIANAFCLLNDMSEIQLFTILPFHEDCSVPSVILLDKWNHGSFVSDGFNNIYEDIRIWNGNQCPVDVVVNDIKPMIIIPEESSDMRFRDIDGMEGYFMQVISEKLNVTALYGIPRDGHGWGWSKPPRGLIGEVYTGLSEFGLGLLAPTHERYKDLDLSLPYGYLECITFVVPVGVRTGQSAWLHAIFNHLSPFHWILISASTFMVTLIFYFFGPYSWMTAFIHTLETLLRHSREVPEMLGLKLLLVVWIFTSMCITNIYEASLGREMTVPLKLPEIETFRQLLNSRLRLVGHPNFVNHLKYFQNESIFYEMSKRMEMADYNIDVAIDKIAKGRDIAYARQLSASTYAILVNPEAKGNIRSLRECVIHYYPVMVMQKNSPFSKRVSDIISRLFESGFGSYWRSMFIHKIAGLQNPFIPIKLKRVLSHFTILLVGHSIACVVFLIELGIAYYFRQKIHV